MSRQCADCHRFEPAPELVSSGGWCSPSETIYDYFTNKKWYCGECKAKYPEPEEYEIACDECAGIGRQVRGNFCEGCDHSCEEEIRCPGCDGEGHYTTHDCNPGCDHSFIKMLSSIQVTRGGITFS